jgi:hypothetical protein
MRIPIVSILKKLVVLYRRIFNGWHPAVKVAGSNTIHLVSINKLVHTLYRQKKNQGLLKSWIFKMEPPP